MSSVRTASSPFPHGSLRRLMGRTVRFRLGQSLWDTEQFYQAMNEWRAVIAQEPRNVEARLGPPCYAKLVAFVAEISAWFWLNARRSARHVALSAARWASTSS